MHKKILYIAEAERLGIDPEHVRAWYSPKEDAVYINAARVRSSEVPYLLLHEVGVHKGLPAVLGDQYDPVMDSIYGQFREEIEAVNEVYHYDLENEGERRAATEEYLAERAEFCGHDWRSYAEDHAEELEEYIAANGLSRENRKGAVRAMMEESGELKMRPSWWREFLQKVKMFFRKRKGFEDYRFTDEEIETLIMRGLRKTRGKNKPDRLDRLDRFAAALRREGAPNRAEERFLLRDGNVPCAEGFMEWAGLKGKGLYADYEFLLGRHPQYFEDQEHVRAAVELVLSKPEQVQDMANGKNASFVGFDEETGAIYRIEIEKDVKNKRNHLRSVFEINADQYNKIKLDSSRVIQPSPTEADKQSAGRTISSFLRYDNADSGKVKGDSEKNTRFAISPVWTGSAADYEKPSLHYVGTGEGAQVYGYGLYGSSSEKVAQWYAKMDAERKVKDRIFFKGEELDPEWWVKALEEPPEYRLRNSVLQDVLDRHGSVSGTLTFYGLWSDKDPGADAKREWLEKNKDDISFKKADDDLTGRRNLYRQTFWAGKEENLLDWDKNITEEQAKQILDTLSEEGGKEVIEFVNRERMETEDTDGTEEYYAPDVLRDYLDQLLDFYEASGEYVYKQLTDVLGSPQAASEFLYRAGIDGVTYIGDSSGVRNYVAFSDEDIQVDEHIRFSVESYSEEDWGDMVTFMKPYVGRAMERNDADYLKHLRDNGFDAASESDAHAVAAEALKANQRDARAAGKKAMYDWLILNDYWFGRVYDAIGKTDFLIRPAHRFIGEDFTGSFISPEFVKYSGKKKVKDKEAKLEKAKGYHSDELAKLIASKTGGDELQIEQDLIDYFRDLKKRASKSDKENGHPGLFDKYTEWKASSPLLSAKLDEKLQAEWEAEKAAQLEEDFVSLVEHGTQISADWVKDNRELWNMLYKRLLSKDAPYNPSKKDLEALNAALRQEGADAASYAKGWADAKAQLIEEKRQQFREFREKVLSSKAEALKLQDEALAFARAHLPGENQGEFARSCL